MLSEKKLGIAFKWLTNTQNILNPVCSDYDMNTMIFLDYVLF